MQRDFKIGLLAGLVAAMAATLWLCTLPNLSTKARAIRAASNRSTPVTQEQRPPAGIGAPGPGSSEPAAAQEPPTSKNEPAPIKFHIVQKGDTLSAISAKYYGSPHHWPKIAAANKSILTDPDKLSPGTRLIIPE
jgi:nucleoid-associated protein YgaU